MGERPFTKIHKGVSRMLDEQIVGLYFERNEDAIKETDKKYGKYCHVIAYNILNDDGESDECVNDTYYKAWCNIPPTRPTKLSSYLGKITRRLALNRYEKLSAQKRGGKNIAAALDELLECIPDPTSTGDITQEFIITQALNRFLETMPEQNRKIFVRRYWYMSPIKEIAVEYRLGESKVKMILLRSRSELKKLLEEEGIII